jgi:hypothetical protein
MPSRAFVIRFPDGDFEYDLGRRGTPSVGETLRRRGSLWSVTRIDDEAVQTIHVEPTDREQWAKASQHSYGSNTSSP